MPVNIDLLRDERVILFTWTAPITITDFAKTFERAGQIYAKAQKPVHSIFDVTGVSSLPPNSISTFLRNPNSPLRNPKSGIFIGVVTNMFMRMVGETAARMRPGGKILLVSTLEEALAHVDGVIADEAN
jgi:hypothetical protein